MGKDGPRKRKREKATMHPQNKYAENPPDFEFLTSLYPSFKQYVFYAPNGRAKIDWTDFNATRELTRVLLAHDFGIQWWIPDGQLCPTVPNRVNYIHWIKDLLSNYPAPWHTNNENSTWGLDIGTGANCIYPLLGAAIHGWHFLGTDITNVAIEWSQWNISQNPHLAGLISVRSAKDLREDGVITNIEKRDEKSNGLSKSNLHCKKVRSFLKEVDRSSAFDISPSSTDCCPELENQRLDSLSEHEDLGEACIAHQDSPILVGVVNEDERFDFCMCNPPFFASMEEAGMNPHTSCGGTSAEMVYPRGEEGFISKIINDSIQLKEQIHWFTTMVGRKVNLKILIHKLREIGVKILKTTEFVQGRTCRWGLAWTYNAPAPQQQLRCANMKNVSFLMEGLSRQCKAYDVLQALCSGLLDFRVTCKVDPTSFMLKGYVQEFLPNEQNLGVPDDSKLTGSNDADRVDFTIMVFEQGPGTLLIKGRLLEENTMPAGDFVTMLTSIEQKLKHIFCMRKELNS